MIFSNIHFKRINIYIFESLLPRFGAFLFLPLLLRFVNPAIWAEIVLMISVSEILSKIYLFGFQSSIFRFAKDLDDNQKNFIIFKLLVRVFISGTLFLVLFEIANPYFWNNVFEFESMTSVEVSNFYILFFVCQPIFLFNILNHYS